MENRIIEMLLKEKKDIKRVEGNMMTTLCFFTLNFPMDLRRRYPDVFKYFKNDDELWKEFCEQVQSLGNEFIERLKNKMEEETSKIDEVIEKLEK